MKKTLLFLALAISSSLFAEIPLYQNINAPLEDRVEDAFKRLTLEEKVALCHAQSKFTSKGVPRLGIPELDMTDGPHGVRPEFEWDSWSYAKWTNDSCTAFPALTALAATWNPKIAYHYGKALGEEARYRNKQVVLAPGVNIYRTPMNGRNFEYMGEDPVLASRLAVPYIHGLQEQGVAACVKHFALNNQEVDRGHVDVHVSDRALREIYLPAFEACVKEGKAWSFMGAYNQYKGQHCCHNEYLLNKILKQEWNFDGAVISDWGGTHDTYQAAEYGLDIEMGTKTDGLSKQVNNAYDSYYLARPYLKALKDGSVTMKSLDDKARRILRLIFRTRMSNNPTWGSFGTEEHATVARQIAQEGIVLLKNDGFLPLSLEKGKKILVVGENATRSMCAGGGSSELKPWREISPLQAVQRVYGKQSVTYAMGYSSGRSSYGKEIKPKENQDSLRNAAVNAAKNADIVLYFGGLNKNHFQDSEAGDRVQYDLPFKQEQLIQEIAKVNPNIVVAIISGNAVEMKWESQVRAVVQAWYLGSEAGNAIMDILTGEVNPSGKLPFSFYTRLQDCGAHAFDKMTYPGDGVKVNYTDDIFVGYRWLDKKKIKAKYPFGYGLSYTTFQMGKPSIQQTDGKIVVTLVVKNTGNRLGKEVVQLYAGKPKSKIERAPKELKAFQKVELKAGESKEVRLSFNEKDLSYWDTDKNDWSLESGDYTIYVGNSSENTPYKLNIKLK